MAPWPRLQALAHTAGQAQCFLYNGVFVRNRSFTLTTGNSAQSRLRCLKNGVPQGSVLASLLVNIYTHHLPVTVATKFVYADDLAIMHFAEDWQSVEGTLTQDMATLSSYLQKWKLKLRTTKTVTATSHLYNKKATRELKVATEGRILPFSAEPTYLGVKLDRSLTYLRHLESLRKNLTTRVDLLRSLAGSSWGTGARALRIATMALIHSAAEFVLLFGVEVLTRSSLTSPLTTLCAW